MNKLPEYETKRILPRIKSILSFEEECRGDLRSWIRQCKFDVDLASFYEISESAIWKLNAQWMKSILVALPENFWSVSDDGIIQIDSTGSTASLRLLSTNWNEKKEKEYVLHQTALKEIMMSLYNHIPMTDKCAYREMLSWVEQIGGEGVSVIGDTRFGLALFQLEQIMDGLVEEQDKLWRRENLFDDSQTTPVEMRNEFSAIALEKTSNFITCCCEYGRNTLTPPDSLLALLSANMSCNKAVLEYVAYNDRSCEAQKMTVNFLRELNEYGIYEVPLKFHNLTLVECDREIFTTFQTWFGFEGDFIRKGTLIAKHMTNSDIQVIVELSRQLQSDYIMTRGSSILDPEQNLHGSSAHRFIFALVLAAAFYSKARTDHEFVVGKNALYAVFPDRQSIKRGESLTIHAKNVLLRAYGLVYFGNSGWSLVPDDIDQYAKGTETRRLHNLLALLFAVKGRSCNELVGLYESLAELSSNHNLVFERIGMRSF